MISAFPHEGGPPTAAALGEALGSARGLWEALAADLQGAAGRMGTWKSYGPRYGWRLDFRRGKGPLAGLYPQMGSLLLGINLVRGEGDQAFGLVLSSPSRALLEASELLRDGRFLLLPVTDGSSLEDARRLLELKVDVPPARA